MQVIFMTMKAFRATGDMRLMGSLYLRRQVQNSQYRLVVNSAPPTSFLVDSTEAVAKIRPVQDLSSVCTNFLSFTG